MWLPNDLLTIWFFYYEMRYTYILIQNLYWKLCLFSGALRQSRISKRISWLFEHYIIIGSPQTLYVLLAQKCSIMLDKNIYLTFYVAILMSYLWARVIIDALVLQYIQWLAIQLIKRYFAKFQNISWCTLKRIVHKDN